MAEPLRAEVLAVGDELLAGDITNRNAAWISARLVEVGVPVLRHTSVGDDVGIIAAAVREALARVGVVVVTGGLGPTQDDLTREGLARAAGVGLRRDPGLEAALRSAFAARGRMVPEMNYRMADVPQGATSIANPTGAAPGVRLELLGGVVYALPGVPTEMQAMVTASVAADIAARRPDPQVVLTTVLHTAGLWESQVAERLAPEEARVRAAGNPVVAFLASGGQTRVKVTATAATRERAEALAAPTLAIAREALGEALYGEGDDTLAGVVLATLRVRGQTLAVAESLTGGLLAARLTEVPGASDVVVGAVTAYATRLKDELLAVPADILARDGAVAASTAGAMAAGVRGRLGADWGLATTGVAGPGEQEGKPVGTVHLGLAAPDGRVITRTLVLPGDRARVRTIAVVSALDLLRRTALDKEGGR